LGSCQIKWDGFLICQRSLEVIIRFEIYFRQDKDLNTLAISGNGMALQFCLENIKNDKD